MSIVAAQLLAKVSVDGTDKAKSDLEGMGETVNKVGGFLGGALVSAAVAGGAALVGIGIKSVQMAADYQQSMTMIKSLTGSSQADMEGFDKSVKQLAMDTGKSTDELQKGLYTVVSAGFKGADATKIMGDSARDSVIGITNMATTTKALVTTLGAYSLGAKDADNVSNEMLKTVSLGIMTMGDYAGSLSKGAAAAHANHVSIEEMNATIATLTSGGVKSANIAMTDFTQLINSMDVKTDLMTQRIHGLGLKFDESKFKTMSYTQQISYLEQVMKGHEGMDAFITSSKNAGQELQILSTHMSMFGNDISTLSNKQKLAKDSAQSWADTQAGFNVEMQRAQETLNVLMITLGQKILPIITPIIGKIVDFAMSLLPLISGSDKTSGALGGVSKAIGDVQRFIVSLQPVLKQIGDFLVTTFKPVWDQLVTTWRTQLIPAWNQFMEALKPAMPSLEIIAKLLGGLIIVALILFLKSLASTLIGLIQIFGWVAQGVSFVAASWTKLLDQTRPVWEGIYNGFKWLYDVLLGHSIIPDMINGIINWFAQLPGRAMGVLSSFVSSVIGVFNNLAGSMISSGADMINNFISGLDSAAGGLIAKAESIASQVASVLHFSKPDRGPLASADQWMPDMMDLFASGIQNNLGKIKSASLNVAATIASPTSPSSFASPTGGLQGMQIAPSSTQGSGPVQITVQPAPVYLDGRVLAQGLLPHTVSAIRAATGTKTF